MKTRKIRLNRLILSLFRHPKQIFSIALLAALILMGSAAPQAQAAVGTLVTTPLTVPNNTVLLPDGHLWIADHLQGLCRLDPVPSLGTPMAINAGTCIGPLQAATAPGQPTFDPVGNFVYLPDIAAARVNVGLWRLHFNGVSFDSIVGLLPGDPLVNDKPVGSALAPEGLYLSFLKTGNIMRITTPGGVAVNAGTIGTDAGGRVSALAFVGNDLYLAGAVRPGVITAAAACTALAPCVSASVAPTVTVPLSLAANGTLLYIGNASAVWRFETPTPATPPVLFSNGGTATPLGPVLPFQNISGLGFDAAKNLYVGDDPTAGLAALQGRLWQIPAGALPGVAASGIVAASLSATNLTVPEGTVWMPGALGGHLWVSDHLLGFCRLDPTGLTTPPLAINSTTCMGPLQAATAPGQPTYDPATQSVYTPDIAAARTNVGLWRLTFNPTTETVGNPVPVASQDPFYLDKPVGSALGPDGKLYISFLKNGLIHRITTPSGPTQTVENVSIDFGGRISSLAFVGNDLYLAGGISVGKLTNVAACTGGCAAVTVASGIISLPLSLAYDGFRYLYIGDSSAIWRYNVAANTTRLYSNTVLTGVPPIFNPIQLVSGLGFGPTGILYAGDDPSAGLAAVQGRLWEVKPYVLPIRDTKNGLIGSIVNYTLDITNTSGVTDTLNLTYTGAWATTGPASVGPLAHDAFQTIIVGVAVPPGLAVLSDKVTVSAAAALDATKFTDSVLTTLKIVVPTILSLSPDPVLSGGQGFLLTITGSNFLNGAVVKFNGISLTTTFVSDTKLEALIPPADIANAGVFAITVVNPGPPGGISTASNLDVAQGYHIRLPIIQR